MLDITKDLVLAPDIIDGVFSTVCKIATKQPIEMQEVPQAPAEGQDPAAFESDVQDITASNEQAQVENEKYAKIQSKVLLKVRAEDEYDEENEKAYVKLNNFRETVLNENGQVVSKTDLNAQTDSLDNEEPEQFNPEKIPPKILLANNKIGEVGEHVAMFHPEAAFQLRKVLMQHAIQVYPELERADIVQLLTFSSQRSQMLETKFEDNFIKAHNYERGCMYQDPIQKIVFKTFLKE